MSDVPEGFGPHFRKSPVTDPWEPLYSRSLDGGVQIGFRAGPAHCNSRGFVHGGVIAALADNALGLSVVAAAQVKGAVTTGLTLDYLASGATGQWIQVEPRVLKTGRTMGFAAALVTADGALIARASASFVFPAA